MRNKVWNCGIHSLTEEQVKTALSNDLYYDLVWNRIVREGFTVERAITQSRDESKYKVITKEQYERARANGISASTLYARKRKNPDKDIEELINMPLDQKQSKRRKGVKRDEKETN